MNHKICKDNAKLKKSFSIWLECLPIVAVVVPVAAEDNKEEVHLQKTTDNDKHVVHAHKCCNHN